MGKASDNSMEGRESKENKCDRQQSNINSDGVEEATSFPLTTSEGPSSRLAASASSPSLLAGCADSNTHAGADIQRHVQTHRIHIRTTSQAPPLSPIPVSPTVTPQGPTFSNYILPSSDIPPDSVFLTPSSARPHNITPERPSSVPPNHLERLSATLLRLVGDHYLCSTCGRQLRTIGDQLTMETQINHITRAFSTGHLEINQDEN